MSSRKFTHCRQGSNQTHSRGRRLAQNSLIKKVTARRHDSGQMMACQKIVMDCPFSLYKVLRKELFVFFARLSFTSFNADPVKKLMEVLLASKCNISLYEQSALLIQ